MPLNEFSIEAIVGSVYMHVDKSRDLKAVYTDIKGVVKKWGICFSAYGSLQCFTDCFGSSACRGNGVFKDAILKKGAESPNK